MKIDVLNIGLASTVLLSFIPAACALPQWLEPQRRAQDVNQNPHEYRAYNAPREAARYSYPGYGPAPTVTPSTVASISTSSEVDGSQTSVDGYSCKCSLERSEMNLHGRKLIFLL